MRILLVIDNLSTGGAQRQMVNLALGLQARGHAVELFCYAPGNLLQAPLQHAGIPVFRHQKRRRFSPDVVFALRRQLAMAPYDVMLSYLSTPNVYAILARGLASHPRLVISERSMVNLPGSTTRVELAARFLYVGADCIVVNSHHMRQDFARRYPWLSGRTSTIYNGLDLETFTPAWRALSGGPLRLLVVSSVSPFKNGLCLVRALDILKRKHGFLPVVDWVGERVMYGTRLAYLCQMEAEIDRFGLAAQWNWLGQSADIVQQYQHHDVLVHPSYGEGLPNVVCEALACALPVIVSDALDHPHLVQDGISGYLFDWRNPSALADVIWHFGQLSAERRRDMGSKGRAFAEQNLSLERLTIQYEQLFESLI